MAARIATFAAILLMTAALTPALGQATAPAIAGLAEDPVYVEAGAETVDESRLRAAIDMAGGFGIDLRIAVLAAGDDAEALASTIAAALDPATVLVFTPAAYGVFSTEISGDRLDAALSDSADALSGPDAAEGATAFAEALDPDREAGGVSAGLVVAGIVVILLAVGVGGRLWEVRTREARQARRRDRRRAELMDRTRRIADQVLELSDPVELAADTALSGKYADATARFDEAELAIAAATTMHELDAVEQRLTEADALLADVRDGLRSVD